MWLLADWFMLHRFLVFEVSKTGLKDTDKFTPEPETDHNARKSQSFMTSMLAEAVR
jgi:hypothetical protein